ncbi:hypothetical protein HMPREF9136_0317 [Prevotella dentalis DSM 3688]|uniref:Uncharacterized protein n=1 Tax=Prevotella dentalis (strain ATCC 49559 / DSM 3688 / JCM 13448 / NCTC 12043 / ES 2772) TaxID=908937 RepID=F9D0D9_PREDD|nr:hypothetical protein HMPREF9136_0317 [Prevotella dentalis DSM 3688]
MCTPFLSRCTPFLSPRALSSLSRRAAERGSFLSPITSYHCLSPLLSLPIAPYPRLSPPIIAYPHPLLSQPIPSYPRPLISPLRLRVPPFTLSSLSKSPKILVTLWLSIV